MSKNILLGGISKKGNEMKVREIPLREEEGFILIISQP